MSTLIKSECAIIGGGLAGCAAALELAEAGKKVELFVKEDLLENCNSYLLAGGLTAVSPNTDDAYELHVKETLAAGKELNDLKIVEFCSKHFYPDVIEWLIGKGVHFDKINGKFDLHREGGHSKNRIFHVQDTTGKSMMEVLAHAVRTNKNINVHENHMVIDLITTRKLGIQGREECLGFYVYDITNDIVKTVSCNATFVATGGLGKIFLYTSNSDIATGDGFAMCYRAGISLANMEFIQFHPTVFYDSSAEAEHERRFLLTEALRGAGAILKLTKDSKEDFVLKHHPLGSKATRDVVSRAEDVEMRAGGLLHVWLDCTKIDSKRLKEDFKNTYDFCLKKGYDLTRDSVPVVYAEHYSNGGVMVDENSETSINGCYAIGEVSHTGLHGATRLASNSGPECILFGRVAAQHFIKQNKKKTIVDLPLWKTGKATEMRDQVTIGYYWETIRRTMNALCGMSRKGERLQAALDLIESMRKGINQFYWDYHISKNFLEVRNVADVAKIVVASALERKETRACHCREDFPDTLPAYNKLTIIRRDQNA
ncbi:MAG: FAD-binding protein [archaeon]